MSFFGKSKSDKGKTKVKSFDSCIDDMESMIGFESAKKQVREIMELSKFHVNVLASNPNAVIPYMNMVIAHNVGLPLSDFVVNIGNMYQSIGLLPDNKVMYCACHDFFPIDMQALNECIGNAMGGILCIDNIESCISDNEYVTELPDLLKMIANVAHDYRNKLVIILCGTQNSMNNIFKLVPDISLYFSEDKRIVLDDYSVNDMSRIFELTLNSRGLMLDANAAKFLPMYMEYHMNSDISHQNTVGIEKLMESVIYMQSVRLSSLHLDKKSIKQAVKIITSADLNEQKIKQELRQATLIQQNKIDKSIKELSNMIGLQSVKNKLSEIIATTEAEKEREKRGNGVIVKQNVTRHMMFVGNPGTGKTTIARLIANIFCEMGLLDNDHVVEATKSDLVGEYVGHTTPKTQKIFEKAIGGILFIDEAYNLDPNKDDGTKDSYCDECITELVRLMELNRNNTIVIIAGYEDKIEHLLNANVGLRSRFSSDNKIIFEDYSVNELVEIFKHQCFHRDLKLDFSAESGLYDYVSYWSQNTLDFGNARGIRNLVDKAYNHMNVRLRKIGFSNVSNEALQTLTIDDFDIPHDSYNDNTTISFVDVFSDKAFVLTSIKSYANKCGLNEFDGPVKENGKYTDEYKKWFSRYFSSMKQLFFDGDDYNHNFVNWVDNNYHIISQSDIAEIIQKYVAL